MSADAMSPRERWLAVLRREKPDRVPMDYWGTDETTEMLKRHLGCPRLRDLVEKLHIDLVVRAEPRYVGPSLSSGTDAFGRVFRYVETAGGVYEECVFHPLADFDSPGEIEKNYTWPSPDWWSVDGLAEKIEEWAEYPIRGGGSEPFLIYKDLRGPEQAFIDLIENPDMVHFCLDRLFGLALEKSRRVYEALPGKILLSYVAEDMGGQEDLMMSVKHIREFLLPGMKRVIDQAREAGAFIFHHNDGNCRRILPDMIELGIDILNPVQWRCPGMDREGLKRDFGSRLIFHGGVDNQSTLPFGTVEDVRREVRDNLRILGEGGGYILAPCHNIQAMTPAENIVAMYETGYAEGRN